MIEIYIILSLVIGIGIGYFLAIQNSSANDEDIDSIKKEMENTFKALALDVNRSNTEEFFKLANDKFQGLSKESDKNLESKIFDLAVEFGADDIINEDDSYTIYCDPKNIIDIKEKISELSLEPFSVSLTWVSSNKVNVNKEDGKKLFNLINQLEDNEDVQNISSNYDISNEVFDTIDFDK